VKKTLLTLLVCTFLYANENATSIEEAWGILEQNSAMIASGKDAISIAKAKKKSLKSMYLPSISLVGSYTHFDEPLSFDAQIDLLGRNIKYPIEYGKQDTFLADIQVLWPLYTGGRIDAAQSIASSVLDEKKALQQMKKDKEFLKLVKYYYGVVVATSLYETRLQSQKALELHYKNATKMFEQGQLAKVELLHAKAQLDAAVIETTKAKNKLEIAQDALKILLHEAITPESTIMMQQDVADKAAFQAQLEEQNPSLNVLDAKEQQTSSLVTIKKAAYHPEVLGYGDVNLYKDDSYLGQSLPKWFAGVMVKIDILKRRDRAQEIQIAHLRQQQVRHLKEQTLEQLSMLLDKTYKELEGSKKEYELLSSSEALAKENYKLRTLSFAEGLSTSVEVVEAQTLLAGVRTKKLNAAYEYIQKLALLYVLSGERERFFDEKR